MLGREIFKMSDLLRALGIAVIMMIFTRLIKAQKHLRSTKKTQYIKNESKQTKLDEQAQFM